jgi:hypothetical protein
MVITFWTCFLTFSRPQAAHYIRSIKTIVQQLQQAKQSTYLGRFTHHYEFMNFLEGLLFHFIELSQNPLIF